MNIRFPASALPLILLILTACSNEQASDNTQTETTLLSPACARTCLEDTIENYLQALAAQDISRVKLTDDVVFTENNQVLQPGDGSWRTFTGSGSYRHYFADPQTGQVAVISTMRENGEGVIYDLRLRLEGDAIAEIESMVIRTPGGAELYEELGAPPPNFQQIIPEDLRNTREELLALPYKYLKGMENNDPNGDYSFFAPDCNRYEHALKTTNNEPMHVGHTESTTFSTMTCEAQFSGGGLAFVTRIRDERYNSRMVVDEEKQTVFGFVFLDHNGTVRSTQRPDGSVSMIPPYFSTPRSLHVGEAWRVRDNQLLEIEMTLTEIPYGTRPHFGLEEENTDWLESRNVNPGNLRVPEDCDHACLNELTQDFLEALITHDYSELPLSPTVRYHENGVPLALGDGLWGSATALGDYRVFPANPDSGEAGFFGTVIETDVPGLLSARLKVENGLVEDIKVTVMRQEYNTARGGTLSLFFPQMESMFQPQDFSQAEAVFRETADTDIAELEALARAQTTDSRDSMTLVADAAHGLVLQLSIRDVVNASTGQPDGLSSGSYSVLTSSLYKFEEDELVLSREASRPMPYQMPL